MRYLLYICVLIVGTSAANWRTESFGQGVSGTPFDVQVADARGDGVQRVYVSSKSGPILEWFFNGSEWGSTTVTPTVGNLALMAIGDVRGEGKPSLYWSEFNSFGSVVEATWEGAAWVLDTIEPLSMQSLSIFIGDGRDDGQNRLYVGCVGTYAGLWEFSWNGSSWEKMQINSQGMEGAGEVGDLRNDGVLRIASNGKNLQELTWENSDYQSSPIKSEDCWPDPVCLGDLENSGNTQVVMNGKFGRAVFTYADGSWKEEIVDNTQQRGDVHVARLHKDGNYRLYTTFSATAYNNKKAGPVKEYSFNGSSYDTDTVLDAVSGATAMLGSGVGRNDDTVRLYASDWGGGEILEVTAENPWVEEVSLLDNFSVAAKSHFTLDAIVSYKVYSTQGRLLLDSEFLDSFSLVKSMNTMQSGMYLIRYYDAFGNHMSRAYRR